MQYSGKLLIIILILEFISCLSFTVSAQRDPVKKKFYVEMDTGIGLLNLSRNDLPPEQNTCFSLGFNGGIIPFSWLRTGFSLNGWLLKSYSNFYNDPSKGISISNFFGEIQVLPFKKMHLFAKLSGGFSKYINMHFDEFNAKGGGVRAGVGYETRLHKRISVSLMINHGFGRFKNIENAAATVRNQLIRSLNSWSVSVITEVNSFALPSLRIFRTIFMI